MADMNLDAMHFMDLSHYPDLLDGENFSRFTQHDPGRAQAELTATELTAQLGRSATDHEVHDALRQAQYQQQETGRSAELTADEVVDRGASWYERALDGAKDFLEQIPEDLSAGAHSLVRLARDSLMIGSGADLAEEEIRQGLEQQDHVISTPSSGPGL